MRVEEKFPKILVVGQLRNLSLLIEIRVHFSPNSGHQFFQIIATVRNIPHIRWDTMHTRFRVARYDAASTCQSSDLRCFATAWHEMQWRHSNKLVHYAERILTHEYCWKITRGSTTTYVWGKSSKWGSLGRNTFPFSFSHHDLYTTSKYVLMKL